MATMDPQERDKFSLPRGEDSRWQEVWQLVISAEGKPATEQRDFVLAAGADAFVIHQAIAILEGSASMGSYASMAPSMPDPDDEQFAPQVGMKVGRYRIGTLLGCGATGSVYAGFDEELNRAVAIKFFSPDRHANGGVRALPIREARAASALNHPNIIMIHEVIQTGSAAAIIMELVPGVTLRALAAKNPGLSEILHWSGQLASALAVAHANSLIHGDIKPENVMVRDDGYVKLLDFGLALDGLPDARTGHSRFLTGTPRYLSPEQCTGQSATPASDIFSFGVMLYELTTGQHPFQAEGILTLLQAISSADPQPPIALERKLPRAFNTLILRMLSKQPKDRPTAEETVEQLAVIRSRLAAGDPLRGKRAWSLAAAALALGAAGLWMVSRQQRGGVDLSRMTVRPLAAQPGLEANPTISPDGMWVSCLYRARLNDRPQLQVHAMQGAPQTVIDTGDLVVEESAAWSPDSRDLAFVGRDRSGKRSIYRISRTGGPTLRMAECVSDSGCDFDWSPDGRSLALMDRVPGQTPDELFTIDVSSGQRRRLLTPSQWITVPRYSPDGKWIAYSQVTSFTNCELCMIPSSGGPVHCATRRPWWLNGFAWNRDSKSLIATSAQQSDRPEMWQFPMDGRSEPRRLAAFDFGRTRAISMSRGSGAIAWVRDLSATSIWRMPVDEAGRAEPLVNSAAIESDPDWSSEGRIAFHSDRSGSSEIWIARADGSGQMQATRFRGPFAGDPHWSPNGRQLAFSAHPSGNADIFTMDCDRDGPQPCGAPKQLTQSRATDANPTWSLDGSWVYFSSNRSGSFEVWKVAASGGEAKRVTWRGGYVARESADGKWLYYSKVHHTNGFWRVRLPAGDAGQREEAVVPNTPFLGAATWTLGPRELYYYPSEEPRSARLPSVRAVDIETRTVRDLPTGNKLLARGLSLSSDSHWLLVTDKDRAVSVVMIAE